MQPKFRVGEVVILKSINHPEFNNEYTVHAVLDGEDTYVCRASGRIWDSWTGESMYVYVLDGPIVIDGTEVLWSESALRKKHEPGEMTYNELMHSVISPRLLTYEPDWMKHV